jgi:integrase
VDGRAEEAGGLMAVVERKHKRATSYWVVTSCKGVKHWERVGTNKREAETLDRQRRREVKEGTFRPGQMTAEVSVATFVKSWLETRKNRNAQTERRLLEMHVLPVEWFARLAMGDVRPKHLLKLIDELRAAGALSEKSISLTMGLVRVAFRDAVIGDVLEATPYVVPRGSLKRSGVKREPYTSDEAAALLKGTTALLWRAWTHVALYGGLRCGEVCGLRWGDWDEAPAPLGSLTVERQYAGQVLKTERPRMVPVHPELAAELTRWRAAWAAIYCRRPEPGDLMFPGSGGGALTKSSAYKAWLRTCRAAEVTSRSIHSTRHTFITFARRGGAPMELVELVTHNPKGTIVDRYTTRDWSELCSVVLAVRYGTPVDAPVDPESNGPSADGSEAWTRTSEVPGNSGELEEAPQRPPSAERPKTRQSALACAGVDASQQSGPQYYAPASWAIAMAARDVGVLRA